ncbi:MAG: ATP-dependent RNA helicase HrpA [Phycisphaeraceae bacterium]|nr:ATP-dependent RNA helicase HrpA [Phycisphaeraceae bacterium]
MERIGHDELRALHELIDRALQRDRPRFNRRLEGLLRDQGDAQRLAEETARLRRQVEASARQRQGRVGRVPMIVYPADLPIAAKKDDIVRAIREHQVIVVCGDTGSGKSTQLPKICLEAGRGIDALVGHTQPRRIAARTLAARIASEMNTSVGQEVGYKVRFTDATSPHGFIKLMTDGILLAETQQDRFLDAYDTLILDEAHERSLNIDFLMGYLRQLLPRRRDLKLIITSATIDPRKFAEHFTDARGQPAPIVEVSGRTFPVEVLYRPPQPVEVAPDAEPPPERDVEDLIADAVDELAQLPERGDILIFLPTERDILELSKLLRRHRIPGDFRPGETDVLPLYARLSVAEQNKVFDPHPGRRRIVLATNVAETSLTVPGIKYVIDPGTARISRYSARAKVQRLPIEAVSQASADQRKGRCGRTSPGVCIRLYSEEDFQGRERFTPPEILRTDLASVILQMKALGLGDISRFPFVDPPRTSMIADGLRTLHELGAVDDRQRLTDIGRKLARLPVDPRIGRMILAGHAEGCLADVLVIAAALSTQDPRLRPPEQQEKADTAHRALAHERSDFLTYLRIWDFYHGLMGKLSRNALKLACQRNFLSMVRMREWLDVYRQLRTLVEETDLSVGPRKWLPQSVVESGAPIPGQPREKTSSGGGVEDAIHRALLTGLLANVAQKGSGTDGYAYTGAGGKKLYLWPGSVLFDKTPAWIVSAEQVDTTRLYARTVAPIQPTWIEPLAGHLVSRSYSEPHWEEKSAHVRAFEKVTLFGLTIVPKRSVHYGPVDPAKARKIFIHHALVEGEFRTDAPFFQHNQALVEEVRQLEAKARRPDLLADEQLRFAFYDARLPAGVHNGPALEQWLKNADPSQADALKMKPEDLLRGDATAITPEAFPDRITSGGMTLPVVYKLEPGSTDDGLTLTLPREALHQFDARKLGWLVPGLLKEKVIALIRALPKEWRRNFVPVPDVADAVMKVIDFGQGAMPEALAAALRQLTGVSVPPEVFDESALPEHLRMNVQVVDAEGKPIAQGRKWGDVRAQAGGGGLVEAPRGSHDDDDAFTERAGLTRWDFGALPESVEVRRAGVVLKAYPTLVDEGHTIALRLADRPGQDRPGLRRLFVLQVHDMLAHEVHRMPGLDAMRLRYTLIGDPKQLEDMLIDLVAERAFLFDDPVIRDGAAFEERLNLGWNRITAAVGEVQRTVSLVLEHAQRALAALESAPTTPAWQGAVRDMRLQARALLSGSFLLTTPWPWLAQYPRYLTGIAKRLEKLGGGGLPRDLKSMAELEPWLRRFAERAADHQKQGISDPGLVMMRWMIEEYRVSLFAQELRTAVPVSPRRLEAQWKLVR